MFVLRRITSEGNEMNDCLGDCYHLILRDGNVTEFEKTLKALKWEHSDELYGFVIYSIAGESVNKPLYKKSMYFVMMSNGETFANITFK